MTETAPQLFIGNRNYSSWSLRPWLCLRWAGIAFRERSIELDQPGYGAEGIAEILAISPSARVPVLLADGVTIHDSVAISEWAAEVAPAPGLLPPNRALRAEMRSVVAEMHAGFPHLRRDLPMNLRRRCTARDLPPETLRDIARIDTMWRTARSRFGAAGPFMLGRRSMADAFYLPVATRFRTYGARLSPESEAYAATLLADTDFHAWEAAIAAEPHRLFSRAPIDSLYADPA